MKNPPVIDEKFRQWSLNKRVNSVYSNSLLTNISIIVISLLFVMSLEKPESLAPWLWFLGISSIACGRLFLGLKYKKQNSLSSAKTWEYRYFISSVVMGGAWSVAAYFYLSSDSFVEKINVFMLLTGILATAMVILSPLLRSFYAYSFPIVLSLFTAVIISKDPNWLFLASGIVIFMFVIVVTGKKINTNIIISQQYQYENQTLVEHLQVEASQREQAQTTLESYQDELEVLVDKRTRQLQESNQALVNEIAVRKEVEGKLKHQAYYDPLTKLPNRLLLIDRLEHALTRAQRYKTQVAVMFVDLNGFKQINDTFGHAAGDYLLAAVADRLTSMLREEDTISRFGGDEFVILIEQEVNYENTAFLSKKVINILSEPFVFDEQLLSIGCSIGISIYPNDGDEVDLLLEKADVAMYRAKKEEEKAYHFFHPELNDRLC